MFSQNFLLAFFVITLFAAITESKSKNEGFLEENEYPNEVNNSVKLYLNEKYLQIGR